MYDVGLNVTKSQPYQVIVDARSEQNVSSRDQEYIISSLRVAPRKTADTRILKAMNSSILQGQKKNSSTKRSRVLQTYPYPHEWLPQVGSVPAVVAPDRLPGAKARARRYLDPASPIEKYCRQVGSVQTQVDQSLLNYRRPELQCVADPEDDGGMATLYSGTLLDITFTMCRKLLESCDGSLQRISAAREACKAVRVAIEDKNAGQHDWIKAEKVLSKRLENLKAWETQHEEIMREAVHNYPMFRQSESNLSRINYEEGRLSPAEHDAYVAQYGFHRLDTVDGVTHYDYQPPRTSLPVNWTAYMPDEFPDPVEHPDQDMHVRPSSLAPWADVILRPEAHPELWTAEMRRGLKPFWDAYVRYLRSQGQEEPPLPEEEEGGDGSGEPSAAAGVKPDGVKGLVSSLTRRLGGLLDESDEEAEQARPAAGASDQTTGSIVPSMASGVSVAGPKDGRGVVGVLGGLWGLGARQSGKPAPGPPKESDAAGTRTVEPETRPLPMMPGQPMRPPDKDGGAVVPDVEASDEVRSHSDGAAQEEAAGEGDGAQTTTDSSVAALQPEEEDGVVSSSDSVSLRETPGSSGLAAALGSGRPDGGGAGLEDSREWGTAYRSGAMSRSQILRELGLTALKTACTPESIYYALAALLRANSAIEQSGTSVNSDVPSQTIDAQTEAAAVRARLASCSGAADADAVNMEERAWGGALLQAASRTFGVEIRWLRLSSTGLQDETFSPELASASLATQGLDSGQGNAELMSLRSRPDESDIQPVPNDAKVSHYSGACSDDGDPPGPAKCFRESSLFEEGFNASKCVEDTSALAGTPDRTRLDRLPNFVGDGRPALVICSQGWHFWAAVPSQWPHSETKEGADFVEDVDMVGFGGALDDDFTVTACLADAVSRRLYGFGSMGNTTWPTWLPAAAAAS